MNYQHNVKTVVLPITEIISDPRYQMRENMNEDVIVDYAEKLRDGEKFPPVRVFKINGEYYLVDGFHRLEAYKRNGITEIEVIVLEGNEREALLCAVGANNNHGLHRTNKDKRKAVKTLLQDSEWCKKSDNWIAKVCGVSQPFVGECRANYAPETVQFKECLDGRKMNTSNIGPKKSERKNEREEEVSQEALNLPNELPVSFPPVESEPKEQEKDSIDLDEPSEEPVAEESQTFTETVSAPSDERVQETLDTTLEDTHPTESALCDDVSSTVESSFSRPSVLPGLFRDMDLSSLLSQIQRVQDLIQKSPDRVSLRRPLQDLMESLKSFLNEGEMDGEAA